MKQQLENMLQEARTELSTISDMEALELFEKSLFGKDGKLNTILKSLKALSNEEKREIGPLANEAKNQMQQSIQKKRQDLVRIEIERSIDSDSIDVTLPGRKKYFEQKGGENIFKMFEKECVEIFRKLGFRVWAGPHIVSDYENFEVLNFQENHPARDMQDTFYVDDDFVLRTHTSSMQNAILKEKNFPIRAIVPGRVFRNEATDARHEVIFTQLEGMMVDKHITIDHLIGVLQLFLKELFQKEVNFRIRPGYFPFVEPGMELDIDCLICEGNGCGLCKGMGWTEVMPCGMIHPNVLKMAGIDPEEYQGFAFGFGLSRLAQMKYGIEDARLLFSSDKRFLEQFS